MDQLCRDNRDHTTMMCKPYLRLVQFAYPQLARVFAEQTKVGPLRRNTAHLIALH